MPARGFSALEVLVSLAIIGVLLSLLLPALTYARHSSRVTVCASNLRQLGQAFHAYLHDHRRFPKPQGEVQWTYGGVVFVGLERRPVLTSERPLNEYLVDRLPMLDGPTARLFHCPGDAGVWRRDDAGAGVNILGDGRRCFDAFGTSYRANPYLMDASKAGIDHASRPLAEHEVTVEPSRLLILGDPAWYFASRGENDPERTLEARWHAKAASGNMHAMDGSVRFVEFGPEPHPRFTLFPRIAANPN